MKYIWITGASSGIGEALTKALDKNGHFIFLSGRKEVELNRVQSSLHQAKSAIIPFDISDPNAMQEALQKVQKLSEGKLDILINNAGISQRALAEETEIEVDQKLMDINFIAQVRLTKLCLPLLKASSSAQIVVISSVMGIIGTPYRSGYAASKHALHGYFDSLRAELHQSKIHVSIICPGFVRTPITLNALKGDGSALNTMDTGTENGLDPAYFAQKAVKAIMRRKREVVIGGAKEKFGVFMYRYFPGIFAKLITRISVR